MPLYVWEDKVTKKVVEVLRSFSDYKVPPTKEELLEKGLTEGEIEAMQLEKVLGTGIKVVKGNSWGAGKGHW